MVRLPDPARSRAVLVGTGRYANAGLLDLPAAARNVEELGRVLAAAGCVVVVDPPEAAAVLESVRTAALQAEDVLLVYFAGHGLLFGRQQDLHLAVGGSNPEKPWTAVPYALVADLVRESVAAVKVVILDCCFSGRAIGVPLTPMGIDAQALEQVEIEGVYVITSTTATRPSYALPGSAFTAFTGVLLEELTAAADGTDDLVPLVVLFERVRRRMRAAGLPKPQQYSTNTAAGLALVAGDRRPEPVAVLLGTAGEVADGDDMTTAEDVSRSSVSESIAATLARRRRAIPVVKHEIARWKRIRGLLGELDTAVRALLSPDVAGPVPRRPAGLGVDALLRTVAERLTDLATVHGRLNRATVNLGVSGRARSGKSTLLQSLSGLDDRQIPSGQGLPVTAVSSRIYHVPDQREARLSMHSVHTFLDEVVAPYHAALGLAAAPVTLEEFARFDYRPRAGDETAAPQPVTPQTAWRLARLREMQRALNSYRGLLTGQLCTVDLADLRYWVAYPADGDGTVRRYLAVRDAVITCPFPIDDVVALGLVDLPDLGELVPGAEEHHLASLRDDVDVVIVVKRPTSINTMWSAEDSQALQLIEQARGAAARRDFALLLLNVGDCEPANVDALRNDIHYQLNDGVEGRNYRIVEADCADRVVVRTAVLDAVLDHLAEALPRMDSAVIDAVLEGCEAARSMLADAMGKALDGLQTLKAPPRIEQVLVRADVLRGEIAAAVWNWVEGNRQRADDGHEDAAFHEQVAAAQAGLRQWIHDGFGEGEQEWQARALSRMQVDGSVLPLASETLRMVRMHLARQFAAIDDVLNRRRAEFWTGLTDALGRLAHLWEKDQHGEAALRTLAERVRQSPEPCPGMAETIEFVLDIRLDYRTRILPKLRRALDALEPEPTNGPPDGLLAVAGLPLTPDGARELFTQLSQRARQAADDAGVLLADEPRAAAQVLYVHAEQFADEFVRSDTSPAEFRRLSAAFGDQLWPDQRARPTLETAQTQRVRALVRQVIAATTPAETSAETQTRQDHSD